MALLTVDLLLALTIGCATVCGHDALAEIEKRIAVVLDNQQKLFGDLDEVLHGLNDAQAQFTCHYGQCKIQGKIKLTGSNYKHLVSEAIFNLDIELILIAFINPA